jgi:hypothetical protein
MIKAKMQEYLECTPFICVSSDVFFRFAKRRLKELQNVQLHLARYRPSNFGTSTGILMHLIRHVCHSPIAKQQFLRDALRELRFEETMVDFGMFFLQGLDLDRHRIRDITPVDTEDCKAAMSRDGKVPRPMPIVQAPSSNRTSGHYPLGEAPSWAEVKAFIGRGAGEFMSDWVWNPDWAEGGDVTTMAGQLFGRFTREYFASLKLDALRGDFPSPITLEDAMKAWTVNELSVTLVSCWFTASNHGLKGHIPGAKNLSFRDYTRTFFPPSQDHISGSVWAPFLQYGYIGAYLDALKRLSHDDVYVLQEAISDIFGRLHCLPGAIAPSRKSKGKLWASSREGVHFITNPIFYKLKQVGNLKRSGPTQIQRVKASNTVILKRLRKMNGDSSDTITLARRARKMAKRRMERLSRKAKNRRVPPNRRGEKKTESSEDDDDDEDKRKVEESDSEEADEERSEKEVGDEDDIFDEFDMEVNEESEEDEGDMDMDV